MKLRKMLLASTATVALAVAGGNVANAAEPYASIFGGASILSDNSMEGKSFTFTSGTTIFNSTQSVDTSYKTGFVVGGNFGIDWKNGLRTELEAAYRNNSSKDKAHLKTSYGYSYYGYNYTITSSDSEVPASLHLHAYSLMANAWYDLPLGNLPITPYVGGGVGMALVQLGGSLNSINLHEKNDTVFAWQLGAGVSYALNEKTKLFADYRYFAADGANLKLEPGFHGGDVSEDFDSNTVMAGIRFSW